MNIDKGSKEYYTCIRYWERIYQIERRGTYSYYEVKKLLKDIEKIKDHIPEKELLQQFLDESYSKIDDSTLLERITMVTRLRMVFHRPLKELGEDPLTRVKKRKISATNLKTFKKIN